MSPVSVKSSSTLTPSVQLSDVRPYSSELWRLVESQWMVSTLKLIDSLEEQKILEDLVESSKPDFPSECLHLSYLLSTPFRYKPYKKGSRFRRAGNTLGVFYSSESELTAAIETAFYRALFFAESPATPWPSNALGFTSFSAEINVSSSVDLTVPSLNAYQNLWTDLEHYTYCQDIADKVRLKSCEAILYESVRDKSKAKNVAVLSCRAFSKLNIISQRSWWFRVGSFGVQAARVFPMSIASFSPSYFAADSRIAIMNWSRPTV